MQNILNKYVIIKILGYGMFGTVYLVQKDNKLYAMKIEKILDNKKYMREIQFAHNIANKYHDQFIKLIEYEILKNYDYKQKYSFDPNKFSYEKRCELLKLKNSNTCIAKIYTLVNDTLNNIIDKLETNQIYSMIVQLMYGICILHNNDYVHGDMHINNVGFIKTKKSHLNILNQQVPTHGYIFKLIDYGNILHKNDNKTQRDIIKHKSVLLNEHKNIRRFLIKNPFWQFIKKNNIKLNFNMYYEKFKQIPEYNIIKKMTNDIRDQMIILEILYPGIHQRLILEDKFTNVINPICLIPNEHLVYFIKHSDDDKKIMQYFIDILLN